MSIERALARADAAHLQPVFLLGSRHRQVVVDPSMKIVVLVPNRAGSWPGEMGGFQHPQLASGAICPMGVQNFGLMIPIGIRYNGAVIHGPGDMAQFSPNPGFGVYACWKGRCPSVINSQKMIAFGDQLIIPIPIKIKGGHKTVGRFVIRRGLPPKRLSAVQGLSM